MNHVAGDRGGACAGAVRALGRRTWRMVEDTPLEEAFQGLARRYFRRVGKEIAADDDRLPAGRAVEAANYYVAINSVWTAGAKSRLYRDEVKESLADADPGSDLAGLFDSTGDISFLQQLTRVRTLSFIPDDVIPYVEFSAVAGGVTPLFPLLDRRLAEYMFRVPFRQVFALGFRHFLRESLAGTLLPNYLFNRPHKGFKPPLESWLKTESWRELADDLLGDDAIEKRGLFRRDHVREVRRRFDAGQKYVVLPGDGNVQPLADSIWNLMALEAWFRECVDAFVPAGRA